MKTSVKLTLIMATALFLCGTAQAELMTATISGNGSGTLADVGFSSKAFTWTISYNTDDVFQYTPAIPIFLNPSQSLIILADENSPINVTQEHGVFTITDGSSLFFGPINMTGETAGGNILTITSFDPAWDGVSAYSTAGLVNGNFDQFINIATDRGTLTMNTGSITSFTAIPEPAQLAYFSVFGVGIIAFRRKNRRPSFNRWKRKRRVEEPSNFFIPLADL